MLVVSADNLCKQFGSTDQARHFVGPDLHPIVWGSDGIPERIFRKVNFEKKKLVEDNFFENYPACKNIFYFFQVYTL